MYKAFLEFKKILNYWCSHGKPGDPSNDPPANSRNHTDTFAKVEKKMVFLHKHKRNIVLMAIVLYFEKILIFNATKLNIFFI